MLKSVKTLLKRKKVKKKSQIVYIFYKSSLLFICKLKKTF